MRLLKVLLLFVLSAAAAAAQMNPHTQIRWPVNCASLGEVYNWQLDQCINMNAISPSTQITWPANCAQPGWVYNLQLNQCLNLNAIDPSVQILWPPSCIAGTLYNPSSNTCVTAGAGNNPGGTNTQIQFNNGGFFGGTPGMTYDATGGGGIKVAGQFTAGGGLAFPGSLGAAAYMNTGTGSGTVAAGNDSRFSALTSGVPGFATQAALYANLNYGAGTVAYVGNDPVLANNGNYIKQGSTGTGSWTQSIDRTSTLQTQVNKIQVTSVATARNNPDTPTQSLTRYSPVSNFPINNATWCEADVTATFTGYVSSFSVSLTGVDAARTVNFYVVTNNGGNSFTATYDSGVVPMTLAGVNTYTLPDFTTAPISAGQTVCAYIHASSTASAIGFFVSGGPTLNTQPYNLASALTVGTPTTMNADLNSRWYALNGVVVDRDLYVAKRWANQAGGYPGLDTQGIQILPQPTAKIRASVLPLYLANSSIPQTNSNSVLVSSFDASLPSTGLTNNKLSLQPNSTISTVGPPDTTQLCNGTNNDSLAYPAPRLVASYDTTQAQIGLPTGTLTSCRFAPTSASSAGANIQAWVIRPPSGGFPVGTTSVASSFTVVAQVGELDDNNGTTYDEFSGLNIPVQAGDLVAFRMTNRGIPFASSSTSCNVMRELAFSSTDIPSLSDTSLNGLTPGQFVNYTWNNTGREYSYSCNVEQGPSFAVGNQPGTALRLDNNGNIPDSISRMSDSFWKGKKIIWVGTSIPAISEAGKPSYPVLTGTSLQANMDNEAVGSSHVQWDSAAPSNCLSLMATQAQLIGNGSCGSSFAPQSYEAKVIGKHADMLVIDHGHNDLGTGSSISGNIADLATATAYSSTGTTLTVTAANNFVAGETVLFSARGADALAPVTQKTFAVLATGLSSAQYSVTTNLIAAGSGSTLATAAPQNTFYGAYQALIAAAYVDNPLIRIVTVLPPKNIDRGYSPALDMTQVRAAINAIAVKWQLPVVDLAAMDGFNDTNYCVSGCSTYTLDGIHPQAFARQILARILYEAIKWY